ncbi:hypothetical protein HMI54_001238 [Coelomomyces lativittatus]|nr:hypothetical protein HMI55_000426 [Coelomomyces lativittatus]KAJ1510958.1 hypothetical protein HMI54_001238 [Coelomomyces lativittatus]KAJ1512458.1 hypothetical protein HMI56_004035 [Coelomomyces lativittatus]
MIKHHLFHVGGLCCLFMSYVYLLKLNTDGRRQRRSRHMHTWDSPEEETAFWVPSWFTKNTSRPFLITLPPSWSPQRFQHAFPFLPWHQHWNIGALHVLQVKVHGSSKEVLKRTLFENTSLLHFLHEHGESNEVKSWIEEVENEVKENKEERSSPWIKKTKKLDSSLKSIETQLTSWRDWFRFPFLPWRRKKESTSRTRPRVEFTPSQCQTIFPYNSTKSKETWITQNHVENWGLDRIDQPKLPLNHAYTYPNLPYQPNLKIYVVDTGIMVDHDEFLCTSMNPCPPGVQRRATFGKTVLENQPDQDNNGHGTFVSALIGGTNFGVYKQAQLIGVKALDEKGLGTVADILSALEWIVQDSPDPKTIKVINMSLGSRRSRALNRAVDELAQNNITVIAAAGNEHRDACSTSPGSAGTALTVGATTSDDTLATYSNMGPCVDVLAPGSKVVSASIKGQNAHQERSGTSFATPFVTGVCAMVLQQQPSWSASSQVKQWILQMAIRNTIQFPSLSSSFFSNTPNVFLQSAECESITQSSHATLRVRKGRWEPMFKVVITSIKSISRIHLSLRFIL